jgi:hypothetical protein
LLEDVGGKVLNFGTIVNAPRDVGIHAVEILFVQLGKAARVVLSRFDQEPFFGFSYLTQVQPVLATPVSGIKTAGWRKSYGLSFCDCFTPGRCGVTPTRLSSWFGERLQQGDQYQ